MHGRLKAGLATIVACGMSGCLPASVPAGIDADGDGWFEGTGVDWDCDDGDPLAHPGHPELCVGDSVDNDCDGNPDGAALPLSDFLATALEPDLEDGWQLLTGNPSDLEKDDGVVVIVGTPVAAGRSLGAECWPRVQASVIWDHPPSGDTHLRLVLMSGREWDADQRLPLSGYLFEWRRSGTADEFGYSEFDVWRLDGDERTWLNHSTAEPMGNAWSLLPIVTASAVHEPLLGGTELVLGFGHGFDTLRTVDRSADCLVSGGVTVGFENGSEGGAVKGIIVESL